MDVGSTKQAVVREPTRLKPAPSESKPPENTEPRKNVEPSPQSEVQAKSVVNN